MAISRLGTPGFDLFPGDLLSDDKHGYLFEISRTLGKGAFATCYLASTRGYYFALKKFPKHAVDDESRFKKIMNEINLHRRVSEGYRHPNVLALESAFPTSNGDIFMVLEYCSEGSLADYVEQRRGAILSSIFVRILGQCLSEPEAVLFLRQLLNAVDYLQTVHEVLHRDIKPGNVLLAANNVVKLADFGLACTADSCRRRVSVCGTPNYVAPEIILYKGHCYASDFWALACTFYYMLCGATPFQSSSIRGTYSKICRGDYGYPKKFTGSLRSRDFINRVLQVDPHYRLNMQEMLAHPLFQFVRRNSMANLHQLDLYESVSSQGSVSQSDVSPPITPKPRKINRCQSMYDVNNNNMNNVTGSSSPVRSTVDSQLVTLALFCRALQGLQDAEEFSIVPNNRPLPESYVAKWVDYTNKFGFGVMLRNGVRCVLYNDDAVCSTVDGGAVVYHPLKSHKACSVLDTNNNNVNAAIEGKIRSLKYCKKYMDEELHSSVPLEDFDAADVQTCIQTYVTDVVKTTDAVVFVLSDGSVQVNFSQYRLKVFLQRHEDLVNIHTISSTASCPAQISSFTVLERSDTLSVMTPSWAPLLSDVLQALVGRCSLAKHSTKC